MGIPCFIVLHAVQQPVSLPLPLQLPDLSGIFHQQRIESKNTKRVILPVRQVFRVVGAILGNTAVHLIIQIRIIDARISDLLFKSLICSPINIRSVQITVVVSLNQGIVLINLLMRHLTAIVVFINMTVCPGAFRLIRDLFRQHISRHIIFQSTQICTTSLRIVLRLLHEPLILIKTGHIPGQCQRLLSGIRTVVRDLNLTRRLPQNMQFGRQSVKRCAFPFIIVSPLAADPAHKRKEAHDRSNQRKHSDRKSKQRKNCPKRSSCIFIKPTHSFTFSRPFPSSLL